MPRYHSADLNLIPTAICVYCRPGMPGMPTGTPCLLGEGLGDRTHKRQKKRKNKIKYWLTGALLSIVWEDGDGRSSQSSGTHTGSHGRIGFYQTLTWWSHGQLFARKFLQVLTETLNPVAHPAPFPPSPNTPLLRLESGIREGGLWL